MHTMKAGPADGAIFTGAASPAHPSGELVRVEEEVLRDHVAHCVEHAIASGNASEQRKKVAELMDVLTLSQR